MKKTILYIGIGVLMLCTVLGGCDQGFGKGKTSKGGQSEIGPGKPSFKGKDNAEAKKFAPDDIDEHKLSALSPEQKAEIEKLYGCYWMDGPRDNCIKIGADELASYSTAMSFSYTNIQWAKFSDSWICCSYHASDFDYDSNDRKVILKFTKDSGGIKLWQYIVPMGTKAGPFVKGREVEEIKELDQSGKEQKYYVYDKTDTSSPKMLEPMPK